MQAGSRSAEAGVRRVLMTTDTVGGVFSHAVELARELSRQGLTVTLATMGAQPSYDQRRVLGAIPRLRAHESRYALEWMDEPWADVDAAGRWLLELARDERADVVHLNGYSHATLPFGVPVVVVAHSCVCSWWDAVHREAAPARCAEYQRRVSAALRAASVVVAPTRAMLRALERCYGRVARGTVVANGVGGELGPVTEKQNFYLAAGRFWDPAKNLAILCQVADQLPWPLLVAGDGQPPSAVRGLEPLGLLPREELLEWMARAAVFLHPARYEPFGLAPLEAARAGAALVLGAIESLQEIWGDAALYVDPDDPAALAAAGRRLATDRKLRERLSARARRRAAHFTADAMARAYARLYAELVRRARSAA